MIPALQGGRHSTVTAIASRDFEKAQAAAKALNLPKACGSYEEILAGPDDQYWIQGDLFSRAVIDALFRSARSAAWV